MNMKRHTEKEIKDALHHAVKLGILKQTRSKSGETMLHLTDKGRFYLGVWERESLSYKHL
jgi:hypothetical protein